MAISLETDEDRAPTKPSESGLGKTFHDRGQRCMVVTGNEHQGVAMANDFLAWKLEAP